MKNKISFLLGFAFILSLLISACNEKDEVYFPLSEGKYWTYTLTTQDMDRRSEFKKLVTNGPIETVDGQQAYSRNVNDSLLYFYTKDEDGIRQIGSKRPTDINTIFEKQDHFVFRLPLEKGRSWEQDSITGVLAVVMDPFRRHFILNTPVHMRYTVDNVDSTIDVPAGKFNDCAEVKGLGKTRVTPDKSLGTVNIEVTSSDWYCPTVGLVKSERLESTDNKILTHGTFLMELESYSVQ